QHHVIDHYRKKPMPELRNVLVESARIARGDIQALSEYKPDDFDALVMPGGMGAAKNLCNYHKKGADMKIIPEVKAAIINTHKLRKPIGALCIAPVMLAKLIPKVTITMGASEDAEKMTAAMGATNIRSTHGDVVIDTINNVFTTPCYMLDASIKDIAEGAENLIAAMLKKLNE
ncbi:MAG: isoprenoid biosynthesis glyoxalase ElbB, partial [Mariniphaga sp.]